MEKHKKNEEYTINITDIGTNGEGIGHLEDGYTLFVPGAIVGDKILVRIVKAQKHYGYGRLMSIEKPSEDRITPSCPVADKCGGCQISNLSYKKQLEIKENKVKELLIRVGGFDSDFIKDRFNQVVGYFDGAEGDYSTPRFFRNKAQYPIGTNKDGQIIAGFYSNHSHRIVANTFCEIGSLIDSFILEYVLDYMEKNHVTAYDETTGKGLVRHVLIRSGYSTGEVMVCLVINGKSIPSKKEFIDGLLDLSFDGCIGLGNNENVTWHITSICQSSNTANTNVILGNTYDVLWGQGYIIDKIGEVSFKISPLSFYQVNPLQTLKLYEKALESAALTGNEVVWDLYCGIGTISLFLAKKAKKVYGIEIVPQAIDNANENARINGIQNVEFFVGKAEEVLPEYYNKYSEQEEVTGSKHSANHPDVIVVDPPRKGCDEDCLNTMLKMSPSKIVYVSCDPATLARDLKYLCADNKYEICSVTPVDMFPNSVHVESVCLLSKVQK